MIKRSSLHVRLVFSEAPSTFKPAQVEEDGYGGGMGLPFGKKI